jgi:hypothetical protein
MADGGTTGDIWQNLLAKDYGGRHCSDQACHGTGSNNPLRLMTPSCLPANGCTPPIPLTMEWATNYRATTEEMNCSNVKASKLLTVPGGIFPGHAGGTLFNANDANAPEYQLIISWVGAPP